MNIMDLPIPGSALIECDPLEDSRGSFSRFFCDKELESLLQGKPIVNINFSHTNDIGAIRGMHFQYPPSSEIKLVRCIKGAVYDVIIDIRKDSETFLKWVGIELTADNMNMLYIPEGFAHGFQVLEEDSELLYLHTNYYSPSHEGGLHYNDPALKINWPLKTTVISERDKAHKLIDESFKGI